MDNDIITDMAGFVQDNPLQFFHEIVDTVTTCVKICKQEETKQKKIQAETDIILKKFEMQKEIFEKYLDKVFDERRGQFKEYFKKLDTAMKSDNIEQMSLLLNNINQLAQSAPFAVFSTLENTKKALSDKNYEWDF